MVEEISFKEALARSNDKDRNLLLGNGFSINVSKNFSYESLLKLALENNPNFKNSSELFGKLETKDFERVLANIDSAIRVLEIYQHSNKLINKLKKKKKS